MKTLITITLAALLTACSSGEIQTEVQSDTATAVAQPDTVAVQPANQPACDATTYIPCDNRPAPTPIDAVACNPKNAGCIVPEGMEYCDKWSYNPCQYPIWIHKIPVIVLK